MNLSYAEIDAFILAGDTIADLLYKSHFSKENAHPNIKKIFGSISKTPEDNEVSALLERFASVMFQNKDLPPGFIPTLQGLYASQRKVGKSTWNALKVPISAALASPRFIYVLESEETLTQVEIANRLSLLLWSSIPDETLLEDAKNGRLLESGVIEGHVDRMLRDQKSNRFFNAFFNQWLELERINQVSFDESLFPDYKAGEKQLKKDMWEETLAYARELILRNMEAKTFVSSDFSMLNLNLAEHYGIPFSGQGPNLTMTPLPEEHKIRGGILGQGSVQILTSNGSRTSPVERGAYVMRKLLDSPPPPAPADVPEAEDTPNKNQTTRELLAHHMTNPQCATCHQKIDSIGFGMESFDALGRWRTTEGNKPVDTAGRITDGTEFETFEQLRTLLANREHRVAQAFTKALLGFGIGRPIRFNDRGDIDTILERTKQKNYRLKDILVEVVKSERFKSKS